MFLALELYHRENPDFICLDVMMPNMSGFDVCREIRRRGSDIPVIFISAKSEEIDKVLGLELGADDFIVKPFGVREVVARIRAITRRSLSKRSGTEVPPTFRMGSIEVIPAELRARRDDLIIELSLRDIQILGILHEERGRVVDRHMLFQRVWGLDHIPNSRTLDQHISQLRKRIELNPKEPKIIQTVRGVGYRFDD